jgi:hypothetical protein
MNNGNKPVSPIVGAEGWLCCTGLTKREYFAAMAMQGYLASFGGAISNSKRIAEKSVAYADAVLKKLEETSNPW